MEHPIRLPEIEWMLYYQKIDAALCDRVAKTVQSRISHYPLSEYQREMAGIVASRAVQEAWERTEKE